MPAIRIPLILAGLMLAFVMPHTVRAEDDKPIRALFICGGCCHDYLHQKDIIPKGISARANVEWTIAYDPDKTTKHLNPIYENPEWYKGFDIIVHDECDSDVKDLKIINETILKPHKEGLPAVVLHCAMHCYRSEGWPKVATPWFEFTGLQTTHHRAQKPISVTYIDKDNAIIKGLEDWTTINEELYNNEVGHVQETAHPLAHGAQAYESKDKSGKVTENKFDDVVVWTNVYNGKARVFGTTLGHNNDTCADAKYLDLVTRGLLWSVDKLDAGHMKPAKKVYMDGAEPKADATPASPKPVGPKADANGFVPLDLARGKVASASSYQGEFHTPGAAVDGDGDTRWCAANAKFPQWWQVDLGKTQTVTGCLIAWEKVGTSYQYKIEGSNDGTTWTTLTDESRSDVREQNREHAFKDCCSDAPVTARYIRVNILGSSTGAWASFYDFEVFGKETIKESQQVKVKPAGADPVKASAQNKVPPGFDLTVYAAPPNVSYCTAVSAAPSGAVFVGIDEDGSLGKAPDKGRVVRCVDTKGTGVADQFTVFAKMDHPRGLIWDDGKLFVLHPPFLSVYYDDNNTGVANRSEILVTGISNEKMVASRGADHTTNGIRLGIDGWIYIATGDFGCVKAVGKDGTELQFHHGGILRVRPDGSNLEVYCYGTRNIYDVAIDPLMNVYTRDNTNDGDAWNDRLAYDVPTGNYGYPSLFMHFPGEFIDCLADYGGGAPCGSLFIDEPGLPGGLYSVEWGNSQIDRHPLLPNGANFKVAGPFEKFMDLPRGTDMDVDAESHIFATSWANGGFSYSGPNVGYVVQLTPKDYKAAKFPDLRKLTDDELLSQLTSKSHTARLATQRQILRRGDKPAFEQGLKELIELPPTISVTAIKITLDGQEVTLDQLTNALTSATRGMKPADKIVMIDCARDVNLPRTNEIMFAVQKAGGVPVLQGSAHVESTTLAVRVAAIFTLKLLIGDKANALLSQASQKPEIREFALRALLDKAKDHAVDSKLFVDALTDANPRVRLVGAWGLGRLGCTEAADKILPLTADGDFLVAHVATNALVALNAIEPCLKAVEPSTSPGITAGALHALQQIHDVKVVSGLEQRIPKLQDSAIRGLAYGALCRLCYREADWDGSWWGTRPDRTGPYYKNADWDGTEAVKIALHAALTSEKPEVVRSLVINLQKHQISFPELQAMISKLAGTDPAFQDVLIDMLSTAKKLDADQIAMLRAIAINEKGDVAIRAKAIRTLIKDAGDAPAMDAGTDALAPLLSAEKPPAELTGVLNEFIHDSEFGKRINYFAKLADSDSPAKSELAYSVLMNLAGSRLIKAKDQAAAAKAIDAGWSRPASFVPMLHAVARVHADAYLDKARSFQTSKRAEVSQAATLAIMKLEQGHGAGAALIETMKYEDVVAAVLKDKGDANLGHDLFQRQNCINCHTISTKEPQKGPMLGGISGRYNRSELCESILKPSAKIAQGFETQWFKTADGDVLDGFVTRESGEEVEVRNATGASVVLKKSNIKARGKRDFSIMPEGLVMKLTPHDLASIIAYLESTTGK